MARMLIDNHGRAIPETCLTADQVAWMDSHPSSAPKTPLEAAIDKTTGSKPGEEDGGAEAAEVRTVDETKQAADETKPAEVKENAAPVKEKRDWVKEAYECFIKNAVDLEPTDPAGAVWEYFKKNAADNLKMKVEAEGKTGASCWKFIEAVARKALGGRSGHVDPVAVYAIAMHYFQDVPKDWNNVEKPARREAASVKTAKTKAGAKGNTAKAKTKKIEELERKIAQPGSAKHVQELKAEKERIKEKEKKAKVKKRGGEQVFFFDLMETTTVGPDKGNGGGRRRAGRKGGW